MTRVRVFVGASLAALMLGLAAAQPASAATADVAALQAALRSIGLYPVAVDGVRGPFTARGVRRFQRRRGLIVDGIAGPRTRRALGRLGRPRLGARVIAQGAVGWDVAGLQFLLWRRGYSPGGIDLVVGPATRAAVELYQRHAGLLVDGLAGPATIASLRRASRSENVLARRPRCAFTGRCRARSGTASGRRARAVACMPGSTSRLRTARSSRPQAWARRSSPATTKRVMATWS
jgi:Putative peptidoglycan binding domain